MKNAMFLRLIILCLRLKQKYTQHKIPHRHAYLLCEIFVKCCNNRLSTRSKTVTNTHVKMWSHLINFKCLQNWSAISDYTAKALDVCLSTSFHSFLFLSFPWHSLTFPYTMWFLYSVWSGVSTSGICDILLLLC